MMFSLTQVRVGAGANFAYLIGCRATGEAAVVDPAYEQRKLLERAEAQKLRLGWIINTHGHADHIGGNRRLAELSGARVAAHETATFPVDRYLKHGERFRLGEIEIEVLHTPGHTHDSVCLLVAGAALLTGDTLFVGECGRTDLPGGDPTALHRSLFEVLAAVPDRVKVWPGHDYGPRPSSTMGRERAENYTLERRSVADFVAFMAEP